jgi:tRNA(Arg) A34 adenosine deaminase TadA
MNYLNLAARIAKSHSFGLSKHFLFGAICVRRDGAIVTSYNIRTKNPGISAHAEARCLRKAGYGSTLYIVRIDRAGNWCMAKPCAGCASLIRNRGVRKVFYTVSEKIYAVWNVQ